MVCFGSQSFFQFRFAERLNLGQDKPARGYFGRWRGPVAGEGGQGIIVSDLNFINWLLGHNPDPQLAVL
jgi:hypothetical protein